MSIYLNILVFRWGGRGLSIRVGENGIQHRRDLGGINVFSMCLPHLMPSRSDSFPQVRHKIFLRPLLLRSGGTISKVGLNPNPFAHPTNPPWMLGFPPECHSQCIISSFWFEFSFSFKFKEVILRKECEEWSVLELLNKIGKLH